MTRPGVLSPKTMKIGEEQVIAYAELSGDYNPLHLDEAFARNTPLGTRIAHGTLSLNLLWQSIVESCGSVEGLTLEVRFVKPVHLGDSVTTGAGEWDPEGRAAVWVKNQRGETVISGSLCRAS